MLNTQLFNIEDACKYIAPMTDNEVVLLALLRDAQTDLQLRQDRLDDLLTENAILLKDFNFQTELIQHLEKENIFLLDDCNSQTETIRQLEADIIKLERQL